MFCIFVLFRSDILPDIRYAAGLKFNIWFYWTSCNDRISCQSKILGSLANFKFLNNYEILMILFLVGWPRAPGSSLSKRRGQCCCWSRGNRSHPSPAQQKINFRAMKAYYQLLYAQIITLYSSSNVTFTVSLEKEINSR